MLPCPRHSTQFYAPSQLTGLIPRIFSPKPPPCPVSKDHLPFGFYERAIPERLCDQIAAAVNGAAEIDGPDPAEAHRLLTEYISAAVEPALRSMQSEPPGVTTPTRKPHRRRGVGRPSGL